MALIKSGRQVACLGLLEYLAVWNVLESLASRATPAEGDRLWRSFPLLWLVAVGNWQAEESQTEQDIWRNLHKVARRLYPPCPPLPQLDFYDQNRLRLVAVKVVQLLKNGVNSSGQSALGTARLEKFLPVIQSLVAGQGVVEDWFENWRKNPNQPLLADPSRPLLISAVRR